MSTTAAVQADLSVDRICGDAELHDLAVAWNELAGEAPFRRFEWLEAWWRCYQQPGMELFVLTVRETSGELVGLAPWFLKSSPLSGRVVSFLGSGKVCSDGLTVFCAPDCEQAVAEKLAGWLAAEAANEWDLIELDGIEREDAAVERLVAALAAHGRATHRRERIGAWRVELPGDWKSYLSRLSKSRRGGVRTLEKRHFDSGRAQLHCAVSAEDVQRGLAILRELHQKRRASLGDPGCFASPRFSEFLALVAARFQELGRLRLQWIELDGRPVAAAFDLSSDHTVFHYQSGMDPDAAQDRPGSLMQISQLRQAIDEGFRWFDFLRGDEAYKSWWRAERRPLAEIRIVGQSRAARWRHRLWTAGVHCKAWQRQAAAWLQARRQGGRLKDEPEEQRHG